jgi:hypothetical protein
VSETTGEIQSHIRDTREDLQANLNELGQKVKSATDWRQYFEKSPGLFLAAALGGGLLLAYATNSRRARLPAAAPAAAATREPSPPAPDKAAEPLNASLGVIKAALIGVAATHAKRVLSQFVPGFEAQLADRERPNQSTPAEPVRRSANGNGPVESSQTA